MAKKTTPRPPAKKRPVKKIADGIASAPETPAEHPGFATKANEVVQTVLGTMAGVVSGIGILVTGTEKEKKARASAKKRAAAKAQAGSSTSPKKKAAKKASASTKTSAPAKKTPAKKAAKKATRR